MAGLLSEEMNEEFSTNYFGKLVDKVQSDQFVVIYHNCGSSVTISLDKIFATKSAAYHFGNAIDMVKLMEDVPEDQLCMGNIDPADQFAHGTTESIKEVTTSLLEGLKNNKNFIISSGCDIPPHANWDNTNAFFESVESFNN